MTIDADGEIDLFAELALRPDQQAVDAGLRQISFVPNDEAFGELAGLLLVSVSGSPLGGGAVGELLAYDSDGDLVRKLRVGSEFDKFDPRGVFFADDGTILISDASDPILSARAEDFVAVPAAVPEPSSLVLLALGGIGFVGRAIRRRRRPHASSGEAAAGGPS